MGGRRVMRRGGMARDSCRDERWKGGLVSLSSTSSTSTRASEPVHSRRVERVQLGHVSLKRRNFGRSDRVEGPNLEHRA